LGTVWGTEIYTTDSSVCAAAVHAGAIPASGGEIRAKAAAGCASYPGSKRNGISTNSWGAYGTSFHFVGFGTATCTSGK
jgi:hypothetical protein